MLGTSRNGKSGAMLETGPRPEKAGGSDFFIYGCPAIRTLYGRERMGTTSIGYTAGLISLVFLIALAPAHAAPDAPVQHTSTPGGPALDPALKRALTGVASVLLNDFAARLAGGSLEDFDPGPALERTLLTFINSREATLLIDRVLAQALASSTGAAGEMPPELRAALALAARNALASARRELSRELGTR